MGRPDRIREMFELGPVWFATSPLYQELCRAVVDDEDLLDLASGVRSGQQPTNMLMAATHLEVLADPGHPFARYWPSAVGGAAVGPAGAGAEYAAFCAEHHEAMASTLARRLVQTSVPNRGVAVRLALHHAGRHVAGPVTLLEVGPGAGLQLRFDRWGVELGGRGFGPPDATVVLRPEWRWPEPPPDLDRLPPIADRFGVDLHPLDVTDPDERRWQQALIWPEHTERFEQLREALDVLAADPPEILAGDAIELLGELDRERIPTDRPLVVWHSMVRLHVEEARTADFDAAIDDLGRRRPLVRAALEMQMPGHPVRRAPTLTLRTPDGANVALALVEGHGRWLAPVDSAD